MLRRQVARVSWWVLASTVVFGVGGFLSGAVRMGGFVGWAVIGVVSGAITGLALLWLLRRRPLAWGAAVRLRSGGYRHSLTHPYDARQ